MFLFWESFFKRSAYCVWKNQVVLKRTDKSAVILKRTGSEKVQ